MALVRLKAVLTVPPGINRAYASGINSRTGQSQFYKNKKSKDWHTAAVLSLKAQGWKPYPGPCTDAAILYDMYAAKNRDVDGIGKALMDACFEVLGLDDTLVTDFHGRKIPTKTRKLHQVHVTVTLEGVIHDHSHSPGR